MRRHILLYDPKVFPSDIRFPSRILAPPVFVFPCLGIVAFFLLGVSRFTAYLIGIGVFVVVCMYVLIPSNAERWTLLPRLYCLCAYNLFPSSLCIGIPLAYGLRCHFDPDGRPSAPAWRSAW